MIKLEYDEYYPIRDDMRQALEHYINMGLQPGGFLTACLENNFYLAAVRADSWNRGNLGNIIQYIYHHIPSGAWGDASRVKRWLEQFRRDGAAES